jgi:hypothetical protein
MDTRAKQFIDELFNPPLHSLEKKSQDNTQTNAVVVAALQAAKQQQQTQQQSRPANEGK